MSIHHYRDHGHQSDKGLDHHNNDDYQHKYDVSYEKIIWSSQFIVINLLPLSSFLHNQCHHYSDHGHDHSDHSLDHHNNDDDQPRYGVSYVKIIWSSQLN